MPTSYEILFNADEDFLRKWLEEDPEHFHLTIDTLFNHDFLMRRKR